MKKKSLYIIFLIFIAGCFSFTSGNENQHYPLKKYLTQVNTTERTYSVFEASSKEEGKKVVIFFHGSNGSGKSFSHQINFNKLAERENLLIVYPDSKVGNWAEGCGCNIADRLQIGDVEFVKVLIEELVQNYSIDTNNIFAIGYSQGGLFVNRLGCEMAEYFRGLIIVSASMSVPLSNHCKPNGLIPISIIQGTEDNVLNYNGSNNGSLSLLSAKEAAYFWAVQNKITKEPIISHYLNDSNSGTEIIKYPGDQSNQFTDVRLVSLIGFGHGWPQTHYFDINMEILEFVKNESL